MTGVQSQELQGENSDLGNESRDSDDVIGDERDQQSSGSRPAFGLWVVLNMATVLFCFAWPTGIPGFVIALLAQSDWAGGDTLGARRKYRLAVVLGSLSLIWGGLIALVLVTFLIVSASVPGATQPLAPPSY